MSADGSLFGQSADFRPRPATGEAPFDLDEMFFSRTDQRGVIAAFNTIFLRVADYQPEDLLNAPHRLIRHPDMPKGVFWLLWQGLHRGGLVGAYVKNRARDGLHYWVFAVIQPIDGGYLSVRIKPSSSLFGAVQREYADLLRREKEEGLTPEQSGMALLERLRALGWRNYACFEADCIAAEYQSRRAGLGEGPDADIEDLTGVLKHARSLRSEVSDLNARFAGANLLTINMQVIATKLREGRRTISEIAKNYGLMVSEIQTGLAAFNSVVQDEDPFAASPEARAVFRMTTARLMAEAAARFRAEHCDLRGVCRDTEMALLDSRATWAATQSNRALDEVMQTVSDMRRNVDQLRRLIIGLSIVRIACRVESGMLAVRSQGLETIVARLDGLQEEIGRILDEIDGSGQHAMDHLKRYRLRSDPLSHLY